MRVCSEPNCPALVKVGRCPDHRQQYEQARGSSTARGYDYAHQQQRREWAPRVATGTVPCRRCRQLIPSDAPWDLGHPDADCSRPIAPECRACNRAVSGR